MKPGPSPKPTAIKKLAGNPGRKPLNGTEPEPRKPVKNPYVPRFLRGTAKEEWRRIVPILLESGIYTEADFTALVMYCVQFGRWTDAENNIIKTGGENLLSEKGNYYQNPWYNVANKAYDLMFKMLQEFGMTPSSRTRLKVETPKNEPTLAELLFDNVKADQDE